MKAVIYVLAALSLLCSTLSQAALLNIVPQSVEAEAWTILDPQSGQVIAEYNSHAQRAPASMTKMMVAYIALKEIKAGRLSKDEIITATPVVNMVQWDESQMYLKPGEVISVDQLLAGLIVMSANDAAVTLAERISGSVPAFLKLMNKEAQALGMKNTHFSNPAGITMDDHFSSAYDMALLGQAVTMQTPDYIHYSVMPSFSYNQRYHRATNLALKLDPTADGLKTGFTRAAGYNLALTAHRPTGNALAPDRRLIVVVMGAKNAHKRAEVADLLMNLAFNYTRNEVIIKAKQPVAILPVQNAKEKTFTVISEQAKQVTASLYNEMYGIDLHTYDKATQRVMLNKGTGLQAIPPLSHIDIKSQAKLVQNELIAPINENKTLVSVDVYQDNHLINTLSVNQHVEIEEAGFFQKILNWFSGLFSSDSKAKLLPLNN